MTPPVSERPQVRRPRPAVGTQGRGDLGDPPAGQCVGHDHLGRPFHAGGVQPEVEHGLATEAAQAAVEVTDGDAEQGAPQPRQHRVADPAVQPRHGARLDATGEPVAHHQVVAGPQALDELVERREVIGVVGVAHDDERAASGADAAHQRCAVTLLGHGHHAGALGLGELDRPVGRTVVGHQHLTPYAAALEVGPCGAHAHRDGLLLVEARHQDREFEAALVGHVPWCLAPIAIAIGVPGPHGFLVVDRQIRPMCRRHFAHRPELCCTSTAC